MHKALPNPFKRARLQTPRVGAARRQRAAAAAGHGPAAALRGLFPAQRRRRPRPAGRPGALGPNLCTFEAVLTGGIDEKVRTNVAGRPRRVLAWLAGCEERSEAENIGEDGGKGGREAKADTTASSTS